MPSPTILATVPIGPGNSPETPLIIFGAILKTPLIFPPIHFAALWSPVFIFFHAFDASTATTYAVSIYVIANGK